MKAVIDTCYLSGVKARDPVGRVLREVLWFASADPCLGLDSSVTLRSTRNGPDYDLHTSMNFALVSKLKFLKVLVSEVSLRDSGGLEAEASTGPLITQQCSSGRGRRTTP